MIKHSILLLMIGFVFVSCKNKQTANEIVNNLDDAPVIAYTDYSISDDMTVIDMPSVNQAVSFLIDTLVNEIQMVQLDSSNDDSYVSDGSVSISDNYIGVRVRRGYKLFDKKGKFIANVGRQGQGPEEYSGPVYDAKISEEDSSIYLLPMGSGTSYIMEYDLKGSFKSRIPLAYPINKGRFFINNDEITVFSMRWDSESEPAIWKQNRKGEIIEKVNSNITTTNPDFSNEIYVGKNNTNEEYNIFTFNFSSAKDSLYHFNHGQITPKLTIANEDDTPSHILTELNDYYLIQFFGRQNRSEAITMSPNSIIILDKKSQKGCYADLQIGSLGGLLFKGYITDFSSGYFVLNIEPGDLLDLIEESIEANKSITSFSQGDLEKLKDKIDPEGNNIIIYGKFR